MVNYIGSKRVTLISDFSDLWRCLSNSLGCGIEQTILCLEQQKGNTDALNHKENMVWFRMNREGEP